MEHKTISGEPRKSKKTKEVGSAHSDVTSTNGSKNSQKRKTKSVKSLPTTLATTPTVQGARPDAETTVKPKDSHNSVDHSNNVEDDKIPSIVSEDIGPDLSTIICGLIAQEFWETAWDICETRFFHNNASQIIVSDLRDSWLSLMDMSWMDTDPTPFQRVKIPTFEDKLPLPPKLEFWSHGALEPLPRTCRESVMDPFLREPLPWLLEKDEEDRQFPDSKLSSTFHSTEAIGEPNAVPDHNLIRPTSPVPTMSEEAEADLSESTWSLASTAGSYANPLSRYHNEDSITGPSPHSSKSAASLVSVNQNPIGRTQHSIEFIYPSKIPVSEIRASSEIAYKRKGGFGSNKRSGGGGLLLQKESDFVAFKLPHQTSSESRRAHHERKLRQKTVEESESGLK